MSYSELVKTSVSINRLLLLNVVQQIDRSRSKGGREVSARPTSNGSIMTLSPYQLETEVTLPSKSMHPQGAAHVFTGDQRSLHTW